MIDSDVVAEWHPDQASRAEISTQHPEIHHEPTCILADFPQRFIRFGSAL